MSLPRELHDTYRVWRMRGATGVVWLDEASFMAMPRDRRGRLVAVNTGSSSRGRTGRLGAGRTTVVASSRGERAHLAVLSPSAAWCPGSRRLAPGDGDDGVAGTILVWRDSDGQACHSAVTIGGGWTFEKPSQTWWTQRLVLATPQITRVNSTSGLRLERHRLKVG